MSVLQEPPRGPLPESERERSTATELAELRHEVRRQGRAIRASQQAFSIFAVMALLIALASLVAIAFKVQNKSTTVVRTGSAARSAQATPLSRNVDVTLAQFAVSPSAGAAPAGKVTFRVHNAGTITHEFVVIRTPRAAADLPIKNGRAVEAGNAGETGDLQPGRTRAVTLNLPAGHYALICNLPGHYLAGQHTDFTVR
jgi:uncharacterized cupredoxin-like copper-binding protein